MARDFDGVTDRIDYANVWNSTGQAQSMSMWLYPETLGSGFHYLFVTHVAGDASPLGSGTFWHQWSTPHNKLEFQAFTDDTNIQQQSWNVLTADTWQNMIWTWDGSLTAANIHLYKNGSELSYDLTNDGVGNLIAGTGSHSIGGRITDNLRNADARIAELGWWNRVISAGEIAALVKGYSPRFFPNGLKFAPDLIRDQRDPISGKTGTLDGTSVIAHPRVIYPSKIWVPHKAAAAVGGNPWNYYAQCA